MAARAIFAGTALAFPLVVAQLSVPSTIAGKLLELGVTGIFVVVLLAAARVLYNDNKRIVAEHEQRTIAREEKLSDLISRQTDSSTKVAVAMTENAAAIREANEISVEVKDALKATATSQANCVQVQSAALAVLRGHQ